MIRLKSDKLEIVKGELSIGEVRWLFEDGEALATPEAINKWFEYNDVNPIDLFVWLVDENLVTLFKGSRQLQSLKPKFDEFYKKFEDFIPQTVVSDDSIKE